MLQVLKSVSGPVFRGGMLSIGLNSREEIARIYSTQIFQQAPPIEISHFDFATGQFQEPVFLEPETSIIGSIQPTFILKASNNRRIKLRRGFNSMH